MGNRILDPVVWQVSLDVDQLYEGTELICVSSEPAKLVIGEEDLYEMCVIFREYRATYKPGN